VGSLKEGADVVGNRTRIKVVKNKLAAPFKQVELDICYGQGISRAGEILDLGVEAGLVDKSGSWFSYKGERVGQGREAARSHLLEHQEVLRELRSVLLERAGIGRPEGERQGEVVSASKTDGRKAPAKATRSKDTQPAAAAA